MTKGCYTVGEEPPPPTRQDHSYRSFICALLVFLCICLIILLASINWGHGDKSGAGNLESGGGETSKHTGEDLTEEIDTNVTQSSIKTNEKIKMYETTTKRGIETTETATQKETTSVLIRKEYYTSTDRSDEVTKGPQTIDVTTTEYSETKKVSGEKENEDTTTGRSSGTTVVVDKTTQISVKQENVNDTVEETTESFTKTTVSNLLKKISDIITSTPSEEVTESTTKERILTTLLASVATFREEQGASILTTEDSSLTTKSSTTEKSSSSTSSTTANSTTSTTTTTTTEVTIVETESDTEPTLKFRSTLSNTKNPVCESATCKTVSSRILSKMNHSVEPCDDFYEFACGNAYGNEDSSDFRAVKLLQDELLTMNDTDSPKLFSEFKDFYESCVRYDDFFNYSSRIEGVESLVREVGEFHLNESADVDLTDLVSSLILRQSMPLFDIGVDVDKQSSNFILQLNLPQQSYLLTYVENWSGLESVKQRCLQEQELRLHESQINLTNVHKFYQNCQGDYSMYLNSVEAVIREMKPFTELSAKDLYEIIKEIRFTIEFEVLDNLDTLPSPAKILSTFVKKSYEIRKVSDLQNHFPIFKWKKLFETLTGHEVQNDALVQMYFADYFKNVFTNLGKKDARKLNNAFLAIHAYDLFVNTVVPKSTSGRTLYCTTLSRKLLPDIWSHFVAVKTPSNVQERANKRITDVFENLKKNFCRSFLTPDWIDDDTRTRVVAKCNNLNLALFKGVDYNSIEKRYEEFNFTENFQTNLILLLSHFRKMVLAIEGTQLSTTTIFSYFLDPLSAKVLTFYANPIIAVPFGLIQKAPARLPDYLIQTRIGFTIARQMARHFDPTGITYNVNLKSISKSSYSDFVTTMTDLMAYSSPRMFLDKNISFDLNGFLSNNERIVDNTAFRLIFDSVKFSPDEDLLPWISTEYSREKVFFITLAQEFCKKTSMSDFMLQVFEQRHLPAALRIENIVGNSEQFSARFSCRDGSGMVLPTQIQFPYIQRVEEEEYADQGEESVEGSK